MLRESMFLSEEQAAAAIKRQSEHPRLSLRSLVFQNPKGRVLMTRPSLTRSYDSMRGMVRAASDNFYKPMYVINVRAK